MRYALRQWPQVMFIRDEALLRDIHRGALWSDAVLDVRLCERIRLARTSARSFIKIVVQDSIEARLLPLLAVAKIEP